MDEISEKEIKNNIYKKEEKLEGNSFLISLSNLIDPINTPLSFGPKLYLKYLNRLELFIILFLLLFLYFNYQ